MPARPHNRERYCMSATDHDIIQKVQQWIAYGDEDLQLAKHALTLTRTTPYRLIAYHAQQCAGNGVTH